MKLTCVNGHARTPENLRPGRRDCKICHRDRERARQHKAGVKPMVLWVDREFCSEGHRLTPENRRRGRHAGQCLMCHRLREARHYDQEARDWIPIITADPCCYCGRRGGTVDHIVARTSGGSDDWMNLTGACHSCNARKRTIPLLQFMLRSLPSSS